MAQMTRVCGSRGTLWLDNGEAWIADSDGVRTLPVEPAFQLLEMSPSDDPRHRFLHVELPPTLKLMQHWREAIVSGQAIKPFASFDDGLAVMQILDAIRESAVKDGERVAIAVR
jgi:predicted dehydrogenase